MSDFLLEIGTEEMPASFTKIVASQLNRIVTSDLLKNQVNYKELSSTSTPRRICLILNELENKAQDQIQDIKGPPYSQAFIDGEATPSAIGFAKRYKND